ncbi:MAG: hypothetical protein DWQ39_09040 [Bacteroidetes bacterium]|nr:MAG: hypothetical protein DWQ33_02270 [Bacteroidota bacterium]REK03788.1 MAG: hypothetical protein DWQ39_09040 [Bacteroidota bacterium]REK48739.1 MAG: hypothetical protein DWQ48_09430 [Bacteroidota bacterium]
MENIKNKLRALCLLLSILTSLDAKSQLIDQISNNYNAGLSARTLPGYSWYQTFTAGITGQMTRIDIGFFNYISGTGTLEVYEDTGLTGNLINSGLVNVFCPANGCLIPFPVNCSVIAGNSYTFHFIPGPAIPDPYGVQQDYLNSYPGGEMFWKDPSGTGPFNFDLIFTTYVEPKTMGIGSIALDHSSLFRIQESSVILAPNVTGDLYSMSGHKVRTRDLQSGLYTLRILSQYCPLIFKVWIK